MHHDVLLADRSEAIAVVLSDALREAADERLELEIGAIGHDQLVGVGETDQAFLHEALALRHFQLLRDEALEPRRHRRLDLEPDDRAATPALQRGFEQAHQILGLLLHLDVAVAQYPERALAPHAIAWEQPRHEDSDHSFKPDEADRFLGLALARQTDEPGELRRDGHESMHGAQRAFAHKLEPKREAEIGNEWKRVGWIDRDRRQHRKDVVKKVLLEPAALILGELVSVKDMYAGLGEQRLERHPILLLLSSELGNGVVDAVELLGRSQSVHARRLDAGDHLAPKTSHPHHVEFIEVRGRDREEAQPLEQRMPLVLGFLEHSPIEIKPGELAIEEAARHKGGYSWARLRMPNLLLQSHFITSWKSGGLLRLPV